MSPYKEHALLDKEHHAIVASRYDELVNLPRAQLNHCLFKKVSCYFPENREKMLDLGAGTGQMSIRFGQNFRDVLLVDHSKEMLDQAGKNIPDAGRTLYRFQESDALDFLATTKETFNFIACSGFLHHLEKEELTDTLKNINRILKKGGSVLVAEPVKTENTEPRVIKWWNKPVMPTLLQYLNLAPMPDEAPLNPEDLLNAIADAQMKLVYRRNGWEIFSRYNNNWLDRWAIPIIDRFWNNGVIWIGVLRKA